MKSVGSCIEKFEYYNKGHTVELNWGRCTWNSFPYSLKIDSEAISTSKVKIQNFYMLLIPLALATIVLLTFFKLLK